MELSVIVPVCNVEKYLHECMDSVLHQNVRDMEIICIDDGSVDRSGEILDEYGRRDDRVCVIHQKNAGYGSAMNAGLRKARGKYIGIVESDDFIEPEMYERLLSIAAENDADVVRTNYFEYRSDSGNICRSIFEIIIEEGYARPPYGEVIRPDYYPDVFRAGTYPWAGIYRREFLLSEDIWFNETPGASFQDVSFTYKVLSSSPRLVYTPCAWYHYRFDNADSSVHSKGKVFCICDEFEEIWDYLERYPEKRERVRYYVAAAQFLRYGGTLFRLELQQRVEFLERMCRDFDKLRSRGVLHQAYWPKEDWKKVNRLGQIYEEEYRQYYNVLMLTQKKRMILSMFENGKENYIFGAGKIAMEVLGNIEDHLDLISGIIVTEKGSNPDKIMGISVFNADDPAVSKENARVFVCVKENDQIGIVRFLGSLGFSDMFLVSREIRDLLTV